MPPIYLPNDYGYCPLLRCSDLLVTRREAITVFHIPKRKMQIQPIVYAVQGEDILMLLVTKGSLQHHTSPLEGVTVIAQIK